MGESFITNIKCGGISSGSSILSTDKINDTIKKMIYKELPPEPPAPPTDYESKLISTWYNSSDVNAFFEQYNEWNGYNGLKLGNIIEIRDGIYNSEWEIAGFNCEHNRTASDITNYDNGYGIFFIPKTQLPTTMTWNDSNILTGGYISSTMHTSHLPTISNNLKSILGDHLINRNVLLSNSVDTGGIYTPDYSNGYEWTNSYATLMSIGQMNGTFASNRNKYDDGEANYKLPLFDHEGFKTGSDFWSRGVWGSSYKITYTAYYAWYVKSNGDIDGNFTSITNGYGVRPLICLR